MSKIIFGNDLGVSGTTQLGGLVNFIDGITGTTYITGNILPTVSNQFVIGTTGGFGWKDIYIGPGSLHIQGPLGFTGEALLGSDAGGIAYTQFGFATPFINVGPDVTPLGVTGVYPPRTVGGWNISATGTKGESDFDLVVQENTPLGLTGPVYSLVRGSGQQRLVVQGTTGNGASEGGITAGTWTTRKLNNNSTNGCFIDIPNASLSANRLTLPSGTYYVDISAPGHGVDSFAIRLQSITGTSVTLNGTMEFSTSSGGAVKFGETRSVIKGKVVLATSTVLEVQMYCSTTNPTDGLGHAASLGVDNIYTIVSVITIS